MSVSDDIASMRRQAAELAAGESRVTVEHAANPDGTETVTRVLHCPDGSRLVFQPTIR